jgi:hypothetical protein
MNREDVIKHHKEICDEARNLMVKKNHDYSGKGGGKPFANFERTEAMGICSTEAGVLVRMVDKLSRLSTFVDTGELKVDNESYHDAIVDIINYCILLSGIVKEKNE